MTRKKERSYSKVDDKTQPGHLEKDKEVNKEEDTEEDEEEENGSSKTFKESAKSWMKDIIMALVVVMIVISILYAYTGNWPPLVVVESNSMMHGDDSSLSAIDTGDLVFVKSVEKRSEVTTYVEGMKRDYKTYNNYGDVIIFKRNAQSGTPIIHRAIVWIEFNGESFDVPSLDKYGVTEIEIEYHAFMGHPSNYISINLTDMYTRAKANFPEIYPETGFSGFLTRGDNNPDFDQGAIGQITGPVSVDSIVGVARGEVPWFGLIKLKIGGNLGGPASQAPETSVRMLIISIAIFISIPFLLDYLFLRLERRREKKKLGQFGTGSQGDGRKKELEDDEQKKIAVKKVVKKISLGKKKPVKKMPDPPGGAQAPAPAPAPTQVLTPTPPPTQVPPPTPPPEQPPALEDKGKISKKDIDDLFNIASPPSPPPEQPPALEDKGKINKKDIDVLFNIASPPSPPPEQPPALEDKGKINKKDIDDLFNS